MRIALYQQWWFGFIQTSRDASELPHLRSLTRNRTVIDVSALPGNFTHINVFYACFPGPHKLSSSQEPWKELSHRVRFLFSVWYKCLFSQLCPAVGSLSLQQKEIKKKIFFVCIIQKDLSGKYLGEKKKHIALAQLKDPNTYMKIPLSPDMRQVLAGLTT